jgi:hypothetical protein
MRANVPGTKRTLLTVTSKMPSHSYSLPAVRACPMAFFGPGAICGESKEDTTCYATKGSYTMYPNVMLAQEARYQWTIKATMDTAEGDEWVRVMTAAVVKETNRQRNRHLKAGLGMDTFQAYFRVHDSGDLFNPQYAMLWTRVCAQMPHVKFWIPTRMWRSKNEHMQRALLALSALPNVALRPSALHFNDPAPVIEGYAAGTTAAKEGFTCPASLQNNNCGDCRACWTKDIPVSYHQH